MGAGASSPEMASIKQVLLRDEVSFHSQEFWEDFFHLTALDTPVGTSHACRRHRRLGFAVSCLLRLCHGVAAWCLALLRASTVAWPPRRCDA